jgi:hypothetical protein
VFDVLIKHLDCGGDGAGGGGGDGGGAGGSSGGTFSSIEPISSKHIKQTVHEVITKPLLEVLFKAIRASPEDEEDGFHDKVQGTPTVMPTITPKGNAAVIAALRARDRFSRTPVSVCLYVQFGHTPHIDENYNCPFVYPYIFTLLLPRVLRRCIAFSETTHSSTLQF